ncbi:MAG: LysR family transcriptional regulator substrate-binding protein [Zhongshania sp.]|uniref:LysR family transcriptional regulator substrate-binding protein n=1 Tax=Zhongshania sp. TaxID=1971902 RepID=UPI002617B485|nr:LysR family transcriptional regulator substrate-binding protein [Zhongshania sp.]MDF1692541.1 LysR family transcriptional regulator substrate-binding protein [Zhongshania sp.]
MASAKLALRLNRPQDQGLVVRTLGSLDFGLYAHKNHLQRDERSWAFIGYDDSLRHLPQQKYLESYAADRPFKLRSNDQGIIISAVQAGLGIACLAHYQVRQLSSVIAIPCTAPPRRELWLVMHPDVRRSPRVRAIADLISDIFLQEAAELGP